MRGVFKIFFRFFFRFLRVNAKEGTFKKLVQIPKEIKQKSQNLI